MKKLLLLIMLAGFTLNLAAQKVVTGKVTDEEQNPLAGVSVQVKGTTIGVLTDKDGQFRLQIPVDVRILSASNRDLEEEVKAEGWAGDAGTFARYTASGNEGDWKRMYLDRLS